MARGAIPLAAYATAACASRCMFRYRRVPQREAATYRRRAATSISAERPSGNATVGADKAYDIGSLVRVLRELNVNPHVIQNNTNRRIAIDGRTTRYLGYELSLSKRWLVEKAFGWLKQTGPLRKVKLRRLPKVDWLFLFSCAAFNLLRIPKLRARCA
jgi:DDE family transposase